MSFNGPEGCNRKASTPRERTFLPPAHPTGAKMADGNITVTVNARADEVERLRRQFQRETLRTSQLAVQLRRFVALHEAEHAPGPWARGCALCGYVGQAKELLTRPLGETPLSDEQIMDLPAGVNDGSLSFLLRFARAVELAHGIETPNVELTGRHEPNSPAA